MRPETIILDTNAFSQLMRGDERVVRLLNEARRILICSVVLGELESGFRGGTRYEQNKRSLAEFCLKSKVEKTFSSERTSLIYGELMAALRKTGTMIPTNDIWIGAFAKEYGADVLSFDHHMRALVALGVKVVDFGENENV